MPADNMIELVVGVDVNRANPARTDLEGAPPVP
jgi:hypothetical protein